MNTVKSYKHKKTFSLESGKKIKDLEIAYHTYGSLNEKKDNVIWVCHALTANSDVFDWWKGLFGENCLFNPKDHFIVCANVLGSNYGTTSPLSINHTTGLPYYLSFPEFTVRDLAAAHKILADYLNLEQIAMVIGGSLGGQQAIEWSILEPHRIKRLVLIATNAQHSPWGIAFNESQRLAITADRTFYSQTPDGGSKGLKAARSFALLSYRTYEIYATTQLEINTDKVSDFKASSYQSYQGEKLVNRYNAYSYWYLTKAMDSHNIGRKRGTVEEVLKQIKAKTLVIGIPNDVLFPVQEQEFMAKYIPNAQFAELNSLYGHDGFLIETEVLTHILGIFLKTADSENPVISLHKIA
ncbi:homoserine O-acetyltransferase [Daejeonella sp. H1SJ63]|jgi:homoserine O-acetyltransferase|uniref:homoserine O-acetyltransferase family protein n=1 Tax=Daejeonella sp. H1SJ63 TaxID=3034145 RepID=UPI0023EB5CCC|nr:homoserine O-acetyltransferase [Daejeonella sp. H1SJ63]